MLAGARPQPRVGYTALTRGRERTISTWPGGWRATSSLRAGRRPTRWSSSSATWAQAARSRWRSTRSMTSSPAFPQARWAATQDLWVAQTQRTLAEHRTRWTPGRRRALRRAADAEDAAQHRLKQLEERADRLTQLVATRPIRHEPSGRESVYREPLARRATRDVGGAVTPGDSPPGLQDTSEQFSFRAPDGWLDAIAHRVAELLAARDASTPEPWVGVGEVAAHLGCRPQRIYDLVSPRGRSADPAPQGGRRGCCSSSRSSTAGSRAAARAPLTRWLTFGSSRTHHEEPRCQRKNRRTRRRSVPGVYRRGERYVYSYRVAAGSAGARRATLDEARRLKRQAEADADRGELVDVTRRDVRRLRARVDRALPGPHVARLPRVDAHAAYRQMLERPAHPVLRRRAPAAPRGDPAARRQGAACAGSSSSATRATRPAALEVDDPPARRRPARAARRRDGGGRHPLQPARGHPRRRARGRGHRPTPRGEKRAMTIAELKPSSPRSPPTGG